MGGVHSQELGSGRSLFECPHSKRFAIGGTQQGEGARTARAGKNKLFVIFKKLNQKLYNHWIVYSTGFIPWDKCSVCSLVFLNTF